ncbi:hypothetical protein PPL_01336 [Heterostelium album PN500]|uniref:Ankyrin repeat protein n=1 Tax=Heterostelium pallidum (strain ATCC 26659 / Pp 5 / PN500) TaxID=670386 RepID=D3AYS2_HETP5|nr:hypothetical protein PPL_01336 [Heterostelium album PN500]EFA86099.1 hypothetical protein PPL_01336 [Heterostelium album PN500]|eukprot:XP_020438205.1 hypothetical protein PPL_01336 [Heterostelium album PN500]
MKYYFISKSFIFLEYGYLKELKKFVQKESQGFKNIPSIREEMRDHSFMKISAKIPRVVVHGYLEMLKYLYQEFGSMWNQEYSQFAVATGQIECLRFLVEVRKEKDLMTPLTLAAIEGKVEIFSYLYERVPKPLDLNNHLKENKSNNSSCFNGLVDNKTLELVAGSVDLQKLFISIMENSTECKVTVEVLEKAAASGNTGVLEWITKKKRDAGWWDKYVGDQAAQNGHLETVKWIVANRTEGCSLDALDFAARNGHIAVVEFLLLHFKKCAQYTMDCAAYGKHLNVIKYIDTVGSGPGCSFLSVVCIATNGDMETLNYLHDRQLIRTKPDEDQLLTAYYAACGMCSLERICWHPQILGRKEADH